MATPPPELPPVPPPQPNQQALPPGPPTPPAPPVMPLPPGQLTNANVNLPPEQPIQHVPPPALTFWQQPWVQDVLPFVTSLALHAAVIVIGVVFFGFYQTIVKAPPVQEQAIIPEATMAEGVPGGVENPGIGGDPTRAAAQDEYTENTHPDGWAPKPGESALAEAMGGGASEGSSGIIGVGAATAFGKGSGLGSGEGEGSGSGAGDGRGRLAPFGTPGGGIPGPKGKVFGAGGNARSIAFVCDSSGSMIDKLSSLKSELNKAVQGLKPIQTFSVIFFRNQKALAFEEGRQVAATPENKRKLYKWLDEVNAEGTTDPIPALDLALRAKPDLMYLLTDGEFPSNEDVKNKIASMNREKRTRVNTVAFVSSKSDAFAESFQKFLERLSNDNGGQFRHVAMDELD